nr:unnamed protein product [Spirometra erinaceieuropaei]
MVESSAPQGSVLGPILFLIYVDDAARDLDCEVAMFADDMKIWSVIRGPADEDRLQMNLNRLEEWSNRWLLRFNVAKCSILRLGHTARSASTRGYFLGGAALQEFEAQKYLGVLTTSSLKPSAHCSRGAKTAMSVLNELAQRLDNLPIAAAAAENASVENRWCQLRDTVQSTALTVLGRAPRQHQDWFDDNDAAIRNLLAEKNRLHKAYVDHPNEDNKAAFYRSRRQLQQRLREM